VRTAKIKVLVATLLLARAVEMQSIDKPRIFLLCLLRLQWLLTNKILHEKLWLRWICCLRDVCILLRGYLLKFLALLEG
jgi:hypothetical protein